VGHTVVSPGAGAPAILASIDPVGPLAVGVMGHTQQSWDDSRRDTATPRRSRGGSLLALMGGGLVMVATTVALTVHFMKAPPPTPGSAVSDVGADPGPRTEISPTSPTLTPNPLVSPSGAAPPGVSAEVPEVSASSAPSAVRPPLPLPRPPRQPPPAGPSEPPPPSGPRKPSMY
jgi:hypothetical protein